MILYPEIKNTGAVFPNAFLDRVESGSLRCFTVGDIVFSIGNTLFNVEEWGLSNSAVGGNGEVQVRVSPMWSNATNSYIPGFSTWTDVIDGYYHLRFSRNGEKATYDPDAGGLNVALPGLNNVFYLEPISELSSENSNLHDSAQHDILIAKIRVLSGVITNKTMLINKQNMQYNFLDNSPTITSPGNATYVALSNIQNTNWGRAPTTFNIKQAICFQTSGNKYIEGGANYNFTVPLTNRYQSQFQVSTDWHSATATAGGKFNIDVLANV